MKLILVAKKVKKKYEYTSYKNRILASLNKIIKFNQKLKESSKTSASFF